jgi:drug/metabolite transporter (DMT)-like permease
VAGGGVTIPEPLAWVIGTLTFWHYAIWALIAGLSLWRWPNQEPPTPLPFRMWGAVFMLPISYSMVALVVGQLFGEKYSWSQLWSAGLGLGAIFCTAFLTGLVPALWVGKGKRIELSIMTFVFVPLAGAFFGLFFTFVWWFFPRFIDLGPIDFPELSWGVQL